MDDQPGHVSALKCCGRGCRTSPYCAGYLLDRQSSHRTSSNTGIYKANRVSHEPLFESLCLSTKPAASTIVPGDESGAENRLTEKIESLHDSRSAENKKHSSKESSSPNISQKAVLTQPYKPALDDHIPRREWTSRTTRAK